MINGKILYQSKMFAVVLNKQILKFLSVVPNIYQKLDSVACIYSNMSTLKRFVWKDDNIFPVSGRLGTGHIFRTGVDMCFL